MSNGRGTVFGRLATVFWKASGINLNGQRTLWEPNKGILGVGSVAFLVRRTLFEAMSRFRIDFD